MGITIHYRGRLAEPGRVEDFEDRLLDFALDFGGLGRIWRSRPDADESRMVRGVVLDLAPGMESVSLLAAPEGWLIGLLQIEDAENGMLREPPWCFTKTQFGPIEGHVALIEMFAALKREFIPDLEVSDDGGYWETRNLAELIRRRAVLDTDMRALQEGLQRHGLSKEAAEDPEILARHIERVAKRVHRILERPSEHAPVTFPNTDLGEAEPTPDEDEALWDDMFKHNRRQQERLQRAIEERLAAGESDDDAFEHALGDLGIGAPSDPSWSEDEVDEWDKESALAELEFASGDSGDSESAPDDPLGERERHPLLQRAMDLLKELHTTFGQCDERYTSAVQTLFHGAGDVMGGLAQATPEHDDELDWDDYGLRVVQLKRALRGAAFARGALFSLKSAIADEPMAALHQTLRQMEKDIFHELGELRGQRHSED